MLDWPDSGVPEDDSQVFHAVVEAIGRARGEQDVLVGCHGGIGRTGTILATMAIACGVPADLARSWVRRHYHPYAVETDEQHAWILEVAASDATITSLGGRSRSRQIADVAKRLRAETTKSLSAGDPLPILVWAIPDVLAITQRPLRAHPDRAFGRSRQDLPIGARPAIDAWIRDVVRQGVRSVIVLTSHKELAHYEAPTSGAGGLLRLYETAGLEVVHMPADDPAHDVTAEAAFEATVDGISDAVARQLSRVPPPAVLHCSAAIDRSPPVAARVAFRAELAELAEP